MDGRNRAKPLTAQVSAIAIKSYYEYAKLTKHQEESV